MPRDEHSPAIREGVLARAFPKGRASLGLALPLQEGLAPLAGEAEQAGFSALWLPSPPLAPAEAHALTGILGEVASATRSIPLVVALAVDVGEVHSPLLPELPAAIETRVAVALSFRHPDGLLPRLLKRLCRDGYSAALAQARRLVGEAPVIVMGSCHESLGWLAEHADGWAYDRNRPECVPSLVAEWRNAAAGKPFIQLLPWGPGMRERVSALAAMGVGHTVIGPRGGNVAAEAMTLPAITGLGCA